MNRFIGFDRQVQLDWLDAVVGLCQEGLDFDLMAGRLDRCLENKVVGPEAQRKTITVLLRLWVKVPTTDQALRDEALQLAAQVSPEERLCLHWGLSLLAYPFFRDVAATVGQLSRLQGRFSQAQVQRRMIEDWGQRTTLERAVRRLLRTLIDWHVLQETDVRGSYEATPPRQTENQPLALWLLDCALRAHEAEQVLLRELEQLAYTFPFDLAPFANALRHSDRFEISRQGLDLEMVAPVGM
ncbi:MAG: hypothetical protein ACOYZ7_01525 [Chloroflexota bacterium]